MFEKNVSDLLEKGLQERPDLFLVDMSISSDHVVKIVIDGDQGVTVDDCIYVSRAIEHNLDREEQDFSLEVASAGATSALVNFRQYKKNKGRTLSVRTAQDNFEGKLIEVDDDSIKLQWKAREPKPVGKGKVTVQKQVELALKDIVEAKVMIKF